ncbi:hypothetical protein [Mycobacterium sp. Marseille-P9652]|uniref:hypothetical protein n=1 Tax=Mycobacterium sp. Marseille-P9652 TaxID=2654950 RepID=UPI0012E8D8C3|nr:hypothetical protein [Mycobacterium sp. Marseille-P9652]
MADMDDQDESVTSKADALALIEEAEAEAAEAEALAAAARARARAARLRREALALAEDPADYADAAAAAADAEAVDEYAEADEEYYDEAAEDYDDETPAGESAARPRASAANRAGRRSRGPAVTAAAVLVAVMLIAGFAAASLYMVQHHRDAIAHQKREAAFVAGAKKGVVNMISLDFTKAKADVQRVIDSSTGQFRDEFQQRADDFIAVVEQSKAITDGKVTAAGVESIADNSAVVLVAATSHVTNSPPGKDEPPKIWRLRVTVDDAGGQYKMSKVEYVP